MERGSRRGAGLNRICRNLLISLSNFSAAPLGHYPQSTGEVPKCRDGDGILAEYLDGIEAFWDLSSFRGSITQILFELFEEFQARLQFAGLNRFHFLACLKRTDLVSAPALRATRKLTDAKTYRAES